MQQEPLETVSSIPDVSIITVAAVKSMISLTFGKIGGCVTVEMILDLGSSVSLVTQRVLNGCASRVSPSSKTSATGDCI